MSEWTYEDADPDVGIFAHGFVHNCEHNEGEFAEEVDVTRTNVTRTNEETGEQDTVVSEVTTWRCTECGGTTKRSQQWPLSFFTEPGR